MKKITYSKFKIDEYYFEKINGTYDKDEKTIEVEDRKLIEFDFRLLKGFEPIHLTFVNIGNGKIRIVYKNINHEKLCHDGYSDNVVKYFKDEYKEYLDKFFQTGNYTDEQKEMITNTVANKCIFLTQKNVENGISSGSGIITNYSEKELDENVCVSLGGLTKKEEKKETEKVKTKVITMDYDDYKKTNFKKVYDSFNSEEHTIDVEVPEDYEYELPEFHVVTVLYKDYKKKYEGKYRVCGGYDEKYGTIDMLFPVGVEYIRDEKDEHYEEIHAFKKGYIDRLDIEPKKLNPDDIKVEVPECLVN